MVREHAALSTVAYARDGKKLAELAQVPQTVSALQITCFGRYLLCCAVRNRERYSKTKKLRSSYKS